MASAIFTPLRALTKKIVSKRKFRVVVSRDFGPKILGSLQRPDIDVSAALQMSVD